MFFLFFGNWEGNIILISNNDHIRIFGVLILSLGQTSSSLSEFEFPTTDVDDSTMLPFLDHVVLPYYVRGCTYIT